QADARRRAAAEELDEAVVAAAAPDRLLLALASDDVELERRPRVVIEPANEAGFEPVSNAESVEVRPAAGEMLRAGVALAVGDPRRGRIDGDHGRILRVEQPKHVSLQPRPFGLGQR